MIGFEYICNLYNVKYKDIAEELGITKQTVNSWTSGRRKIPKKYIPDLSKKFTIPEEYFQKEIDDMDELNIQRIKLTNELDPDVLEKSFKELLESKDIFRNINNIANVNTKIKCIQIIEKMKKILEFKSTGDRVSTSQNLTYLEAAIDIIESDNFYIISMAYKISMLLLYYYKPDEYKEIVYTSKLDLSDDYKQLIDDFNKSILKSIKDFFEAERKIELKQFDDL